MAPQLYITMYKEQFGSPGRVKRTELRPTSANRRNNPQPRPDFLFPRRVQSNYGQTRAPSRPLPPVDIGRPRLPPVRHLSFHSPVTARPENSQHAVITDRPQHMPSVIAATPQVLPSAGRKQNLQLKDSAAGAEIQLHSSSENPQKTMNNLGKVYALSALQRRQQTGPHLPTRPQTSNLPATPHCCPRTQHRRCCSHSTRAYSGCYSCFHVVRAYQAGHYIIHPEFVSESLY